MKAEKIEERLAKLLGLENQLEELKPKEATPEQKSASHEAEAVLYFMHDPTRFKQAACKQCDGTFMVDYPSVGYCSDRCRKAALHEIGIEWNPDKDPYERWQGRVPLTVPPQALAVIPQTEGQTDTAVG